LIIFAARRASKPIVLKNQDLSPRQSFLLKRFVDRKDELQRFCQMLETSEQLVLIVTGESGIGKSTFMARLIDECRKRNWYRALVPCDLMTNVDYRSVMRKLRSEIGRDYFALFDDADKEVGEPEFRLKLEGNGGGNISVAEQAKIGGRSSIRDIVGVQLNVPQEYLDSLDKQREKERRSTLTDLFVECLAEVTQENRLVIFFDAVENMPKDVENWVMDELIVAAVTGTIRNVKFVQCGQRKPDVSEGIEFAVHETPLNPLGELDIVEYLKKRGVQSDDPEEDARKLLAMTGGYAGRVANVVDAHEEKPGK
jgi:hypothetical protein